MAAAATATTGKDEDEKGVILDCCVEGEALHHVLDWCVLSGISSAFSSVSHPPLQEDRLRGLSIKQLARLALAADYLEIVPLYHKSLDLLAERFQGLTTKRIRDELVLLHNSATGLFTENEQLNADASSSSTPPPEPMQSKPPGATTK